MSMWDSNVTSDVNVMKKRMRARMSAIRKMLGEEGRARMDARIAEKVCAHPAFQDADFVFTYLSFGEEVDTRQIIRNAWEAGKTVAVPRCVPHSNKMNWYRIESFDGLEDGAFGIKEPPADPEKQMKVPGEGSGVKAVAIVPAFSFDAHGYRLGYGGGFYDVFLPTFAGTSMGLCRTSQISEEPLPHDDHDVPVDIVITD